MAVKCSFVDSYSYYGKCIRLENDSLEILITVDVGPRIIYLGLKGGENLLFNAAEDERVDNSPLFQKVFGEGTSYHFYGGVRMWLAPQKIIYTESPDNDPVSVEEIENGVRLTCPEAKVIGFRSQMTVVMDPEEAKITVSADFTNTGEETKKNAVWLITQCAPGGVGFVPFVKPRPKRMRLDLSNIRLEDFQNPIKPGGALIMFVGGFTDPRLKMDDRWITVSFSKEEPVPLKIGTRDTEGFALFAVNGCLLRWDFPYDEAADYTDYGSNFESYTDAAFTEMEMLGPYREYRKGESISHSVTIGVKKLSTPIPDPADREAVAAFIEANV